MYAVGLTGGIACGKSTTAALFTEKKIDVISADDIAAHLLAPHTETFNTVLAKLGNRFLQNDGSINRQMLREHIFKNTEDKRWLETLLHPLIRQRISAQIAKATSPYVIVEIPLLLESTTPFPVIDRVLVIDTPGVTQIKRASTRDATSSPALIAAIIAQQVSRETRCARADDIIDNSGDRAALTEQIQMLHEKYLRLSQA